MKCASSRVYRQFEEAVGPPHWVMVLEAGEDTLVRRVLGRAGRSGREEDGREEGGREEVVARVAAFHRVTREVVREYGNCCTKVREEECTEYTCYLITNLADT